MRPEDILDMIGDARGEHILDAQQVRGGGACAKARKLPPRKVWLIAALIALMLLLVGCTIAYASGWFVEFFANKSEAPLSDSQIALIEAKEQPLHDSQTQNGWTVELRSAIRDGSKALIIIGITGPEGVDLEPEVVDNELTEWFSPGNDGLASAQAELPEVIGVPEGVSLPSVRTSWEDDGNGLDNTKNYVIELQPDIPGSAVDPFGPDAVWRIHIENIVRTYDDEQYKQMLLDTKYKGDYGVMFTPEEIQRMQQREVLAEGIWDFTVTFADQDPGLSALELLTAPIQTQAEIPKKYGDGIFDYVCVREDVTVTSIRLQSFSAMISYEPYEPFGGEPTFYFDDGDIDQSDIVYAYCVLRDGSRITLQDMGNGGEGYKLLDAGSPLVLEEVDHILLPDGTRVYTDGTVEYAAKKALPAAALDYQDIASDTGVYAYYGDFDQDSVEDMAIWYDGAFHALCLLDANGNAKKVFPFENGMDVFETYNQRAAQIKHEPNQIRILETEGDVSTLRLFRAEADGLYLSVGVRYDPNGAWFQSVTDFSVPYDPAAETWEPINEEAYRRIVEDYQVMRYRLIPIQ